MRARDEGREGGARRARSVGRWAADLVRRSKLHSSKGISESPAKIEVNACPPLLRAENTLIK
eukprot:5464278-Pyramimonas_sp.AAC.1